MDVRLKRFSSELSEELFRILSFWESEAPDAVNGGFLGQIDFNGNKNPDTDKGAVLHARILWSFSAAYRQFPKTEYKVAATRAYRYLCEHFQDTVYGGIFWSVSADGKPADTKKQIYALAFAIYGLSEYYAAFSDESALDRAISLYQKIEKYSFDPLHNGYYEAFTRDWKTMDDLRLSEKDANEKKTMNTHLHIAEAYANLYSSWPDERLKAQLQNLLEVIDQRFFDASKGNYKLFFSEDWIEKPDVISFGHDIEAAWLLLHCAVVSGNDVLINKYEKNALLVAEATKQGVDSHDGGLWYEYDPSADKLIAEKHWWPQSEMQLGYFAAWRLSRKEDYLEMVLKNWEFTKEFLIDREKGEWLWGVDSAYAPIQKDKAGFWKCPYHNSRGCLELIRQIQFL